jgi:hypothetical protein
LPKGILYYFELSKIVEAIPCLHICLEEKNLPPGEHKDQKLESKGFLPEVYIQDFPIRNQKVTLCIKRRRWEVKNTGEIISRDWNMVQQGTRMTKEFADFLKPGRRAGLYRYQPRQLFTARQILSLGRKTTPTIVQ